MSHRAVDPLGRWHSDDRHIYGALPEAVMRIHGDVFWKTRCWSLAEQILLGLAEVVYGGSTLVADLVTPDAPSTTSQHMIDKQSTSQY